MEHHLQSRLRPGDIGVDFSPKPEEDSSVAPARVEVGTNMRKTLSVPGGNRNHELKMIAYVFVWLVLTLCAKCNHAVYSQ